MNIVLMRLKKLIKGPPGGEILALKKVTKMDRIPKRTMVVRLRKTQIVIITLDFKFF